MDRYTVMLLSSAYADLDEIYSYIAVTLHSPVAATNLQDKLEEAIFSLESMPHRYARRTVGAYANRGYRQVFVKNYTIVYRIDESTKQVVVITVKYSRSQF